MSEYVEATHHWVSTTGPPVAVHLASHRILAPARLLAPATQFGRLTCAPPVIFLHIWGTV
jgi:hypothetical protein